MPASLPQVPAHFLPYLSRAYPKGIFEEDSGERMPSSEFNVMVGKLRAVREELCLSAHPLWQMPHATTVVYALQHTPPFPQWIGLTDEGKNQAREKYQLDDYHCLFLVLSKIAPGFKHYLNRHAVDPITGRWAISSSIDEVPPEWAFAQSRIHECLLRHGWLHMDRNLCTLPHPAISCIDEEHPSWVSDEEDPDFENPPRKPASLHTLLFADE